MEAKIVVGLGYGDEGKGITTDFLCSQNNNSCVVRYSGGQQAGHTVIVGDTKHIFSNFGAGSLRGVPTYFSEFTTFYPTTINLEREILQSKGINPILVLHPLSKMTTPYDVFANRNCDDNLNHGTCGLGIGKTMKRHEHNFNIFAIDLLNLSILKAKLKSIKENYYKYTTFTEKEEREIAYFENTIENTTWVVQDNTYLKAFDNLIFEGSQGVLLDMTHGIFPNVTYSNTVSKNAIQICKTIGVENVELFYITRCYSTRHGNGEYVEKELILKNNEEEINKFNPWQGDFKVAPIDYNLLNYALSVDNIYSKNLVKNLVVTCCDQLENYDFDYTQVKTEFSKKFESWSPKTDLKTVKQ